MLKTTLRFIGILFLLTGCLDEPEATLKVNGKVVEKANVMVTVDGEIIENAIVHIDGEVLVTVKPLEQTKPKINKKPIGAKVGDGKRF